MRQGTRKGMVYNKSPRKYSGDEEPFLNPGPEQDDQVTSSSSSSSEDEDDGLFPIPPGVPPGLSIRNCVFMALFFVSVTTAVLGGYAYRDLNLQKKFHNTLIQAGEYLPTSFNDWMKSFHAPETNKGSQKVKNDGKKTDGKKQDGKNKGKRHNWLNGPSIDPKLKLFSLDDIKFNEGGKLYLVLVGHVFDVTGAEYYQPGSGYHAFIGQDASRSFVSGEFSQEALTDDLTGLQASDYIGLSNWLKFYLEHETYKFVGYLVGTYFDDQGKETEAMSKFKELLKWGEDEAEKEGDLLKLFPSCNVEWKASEGSTLWCSARSGGVERDWVGFPRKFFEKPGKDRCACVHPNYLADPRVKMYDDCPSNSDTCKLKETATQ